jgi:hypothetical protein
VRALYTRVVAKHPQRKAIAIGHAMRKLLHLVFAIWKSGRPFAADRYPWLVAPAVETGKADRPVTEVAEGQAAGHRPDTKPAPRVVAADCADGGAGGAEVGQDAYLDFAYLKKQLPLLRVLDQLGLSDRLRGHGAQRRCARPLHRGDARGRTFSANLDENVFHCFHKHCGRKGDVIDQWAAVHGYGLREAVLDLVRTFGLEPAPSIGIEKRHG